MPVEPLFYFGHGLSYSRFNLTNLRASNAEFKRGDELTIEVDVFNEGPIAGEATVFLFVRDVVASVARPVRELKGVGKIALAPGEGGTVLSSSPPRRSLFRGAICSRFWSRANFCCSPGKAPIRGSCFQSRCAPCRTERRPQ